MKDLTFIAAGVALVGAINLIDFEPAYKYLTATPEQREAERIERIRYQAAVKASKQTGREVRRVMNASTRRPSKAYCSAMADAYLGIRGEIQAMNLDRQLESDADSDVYAAWQHEARKAGCIS